MTFVKNNNTHTTHTIIDSGDTSLLSREIAIRRTFAIISHPDAGKTTLTEKLLLYGGALHEAGSIKQRKAARHAASDWMAIEQERGISVTSSVLRFEKAGIRYNLLDTPGHKDFSEDTFRTLIAADCALMVIYVARGVEEQTEKLFEVCRLRNIPVITFVNKCDRPGMEPLEVLSNIESKLGITAVPASWPIGYGTDFQGVYDLIGKELHLYLKKKHGAQKADSKRMSMEQGLRESALGDTAKDVYREELTLIGDEFDNMEKSAFEKGEVTPVFFGSALNNFGLDLFLNYFPELAPPPETYETVDGSHRDPENDFSGFVFKLQANMNPEHRDCTAFLRVASGVFQRGMEVTLADNGRKIRMSTPHSLMGEERKLLDTAYPGDIVALFNPGDFRIGSTLYTNEPVQFDIIPLFSPEYFRKASSKDPFKRKQLRQGLRQLSEEGVVHVFELPGGVGNELLLGAVGALQFEVVKHRMKTEYKADIVLAPTSYMSARWLPDDEKVISRLKASYSTNVTYDIEGHPIVLFESRYALDSAAEAVGEENLLKFKK